MRMHRPARGHLVAVPSGLPRTPAETAEACIRRALDAARTALAEDGAASPDLAALAAAAGVSVRSLQRHFARVLGRSPQAVLLQLRLAAARQTLAAGGAATVLDAALRHGFGHPGRFAIAYTRAFGEAPSATRRAAKARPPARAATPDATRVQLRPLRPATAAEACCARRATDDLAIAIGRARDLLLLASDAPFAEAARALRLEGRVEADHAVLSLVQPTSGVVLLTLREALSLRAGRSWADRAVSALRGAIAQAQVERARRTPRHRADAATLVQRARPAALSQEPALIAMALELLDEALLRDPVDARALALAAWCHAIGANHGLTRDPDEERARAMAQCRSALALAMDDPQVLTPVAGAMSLTWHIDEAEQLVTRSLALDPDQPEALRRLGFIQNFRGDGQRAVAAFRRALNAYPTGHDGAMGLVGLGVARFILGDYGHAARSLARGLGLQPSLVWPHRFLAAAAAHAGVMEEAHRSVASLRRTFPDLTVDLCARADALHAEAKLRVLDGLARAGLPR